MGKEDVFLKLNKNDLAEGGECDGERQIYVSNRPVMGKCN